jgi:hypothetical protein
MRMGKPTVNVRLRGGRVGVLLAVGSVVALVVASCTDGRPPPTTPTTAPPTGEHAPWRTCANPAYQAGRHLNGGDHDMDHGGGEHEHEVPERLNHPPTEAQKQWARNFVAATKQSLLARFRTPAQAVAAGYNNIGDGVHYTNGGARGGYRHDGCEMWPERPESLVYIGGQVAAAMYNMEPETTLGNVYDFAGNWTVFHGHSTLCWQSNIEGTPGFTRLAGTVINGRCTSGYINPPVLMIHSWVRSIPQYTNCGAFASMPGLGPGSCVPELQP